MQNHEFKEQSAAAEASFIDELSGAGSSVIRYALTRISLFTMEAKIAMTSVVLMLVVALLCVLLISATWALVCWAIIIVLKTYVSITTLSAVMIVAALNLVAAFVGLKCIVALSAAFQFKETLQFDSDQTQIKNDSRAGIAESQS